MSLEPYDRSAALSLISHPVAIITVNWQGRLNGMTAAWVARMSVDPPIVCVSISPERYTWDLLESSEHFGVSLLGEGQEELAMSFGTTSGRDTNKFAANRIEPFIALEGVPLIGEALASFVCRKLKSVEVGDHFAVFGEVVQAWRGLDLKPLQWFKSEMKR